MCPRLLSSARFCLVAVVFVSLCVTSPVLAQTVTLAWDPSPESDIAGYIINYGTQSGVYNKSKNVGAATTGQITDLAAGSTYYFTVTAYTTSLFYSPASNEVSYSVLAAAGPTITAVTPATGPTAGGTSITVTGTNFATGTVVRICGAVAPYYLYVHSGAMTAQTPAHAAGACDVQVVNPDTKSATKTAAFTFTNVAQPPALTPTLTSIAPASGPPIGGTVVTLAGTNFEAGATVSIGGVAALSVQVVNATTITARTPTGAVGPRTVLVTNPSGKSAQLTNGYTYVANNTDDADGDGMPDAWEIQYGLDPHSAIGADGADGDPDGDGAKNLAEYHADTHPRAVANLTRYFAEGADSGFFDTRFALMNPQGTPAHVRVEFMDEQGRLSHKSIVISPRSRATIDSKSMTSLLGNSFSTKVETDIEVVADRLMGWGAGHYGSSAETAVVSPGTTWYLAEGATGGPFDLYYLIENATDQLAKVQVRYLRPGKLAPIVKSYDVQAHRRFNIHVNDEAPELKGAEVSAEITSTNAVPIIVERAMYITGYGQLYVGGHESAAVQQPASEWFFAEGATGTFWSMYILLENPSSETAQVSALYMLPDGQTIEKKYKVGPNARYTVDVNGEHPRLANAAMSTRVTSNVPIVAERTMWWPNNGQGWYEGHNSFGSTSTGTRWGLAEGELGGPDQNATYILVANTSTYQGRIRVTLLFEDRAEVSQEFILDPTSRTNIQFGGSFGAADGRRFSTLVESIGDQKAQIVVERAMYSSFDGKLFSSGSDSLGAKLQQQ